LAKASKYEMGSAPGLKTKIIGVVEVESSNEPFKSKIGDSIKILPRTFKTNFFMIRMSFSYLNNLYTTIFWKMSSLTSKFSGNLISEGFSAFMIYFQAL
jgi:hypothetical protein